MSIAYQDGDTSHYLYFRVIIRPIYGMSISDKVELNELVQKFGG